MFLYKFVVPYNEYEIKKRILKNTKPYRLTNMSYEGNYMSEIHGNNIIIVKIPLYKKSIFTSFFCGKLLEKNNKYYIYGRFAYPFRIFLPQFVFFFAFVTILCIINRNIFILCFSILGYLLMIFFSIILLNINTKAKKDILDFIQSILDAEVCK